MDAWVTDGRVDTLLHSGNRVYAGGEFSRIGPFTGGGVDLPAPADAAPAPNLAFARVQGIVNAVAPDGAGGWYVGGVFERVGGVARQNLVHILAGGGVDPAWDPAANGSVDALLVTGGSVFAGGGFTEVDGQNRLRLVKLSAGSGAVDPTFVSQVTVSDENVHGQPHVSALALETGGANLFVGGNFDTVDGTGDKEDLAKVEVGDGDIVGGFDADTAPNTEAEGAASGVLALAASGTTLHVGGFFDSVDGLARANLAAVDQEEGNALPGFQADADSTVHDLELDGTDLFAAGSFDNVTDSGGAKARSGLAKLTAATGAVAANWIANVNQTVIDIEVSGTTLYAAGFFSTMVGLERPNLGAVPTADDPTGVDPSAWNPRANNQAQALAIQGGRVYAGGQFTSIGGVGRNGLVALDATAGTAIEGFDAGLDDGTRVRGLLLSGGRLYVGGNFTVGDNENLAAVDPIGGAVDPDFDPVVDDQVLGLAASGDMLFAGGAFDNPKVGLAAFDLDTGATEAWDAPISGGVGQFVSTLLASGDLLYVGGSFDTLDSAPRPNLGAVTISTAAASGWGAGGADGRVNALALGSGRLYVAGGFTQVSGGPRGGAAAVDPATGALLPWDSGIVGFAGSGEAVALSSSGVYLGGAITEIAGQERNNVVALSSDIGALSAWRPRLAFSVYALAAGSARIWVGGNFDFVGEEVRDNLAAFPFVVPANTTPPAISSDLGGLACSPGSWVNDPNTFDFQWLRDGAPIGGATGTSYAPGAGDVNTGIACRVTATNEAGSAVATSSPLTVPAPPPGPSGARDSAVANMSIGGTITLTSRGVLELTLACSRLEVRCTGTAQLVTDRAIEVSAKRRLRLGRRSFRIAGGKRAKVRFRLSRRNLRAVRSQRRLRIRVTVDARDAAGNRRRFTKRARVKVQRRRR